MTPGKPIPRPGRPGQFWPTVQVICLGCGKSFDARRSEVRAGKGKYCSPNCCVRAGGKAFVEKYGIMLSETERKFRMKIRWRTLQAIRSGELIPSECETCGAKQNIQAHHDDYLKVFDVRWLCRPCHSRHHMQERFAD